MSRTIAFVAFVALTFCMASRCLAQSGMPPAIEEQFGVALTHAESISALHSEHTHPYHLKATIIETTNPQSEYHATVEEFFQSPKNWQRTVTAPDLNWTQRMQDGKIEDRYTGDYAPLWLREILTGIADPLPNHATLERVDQTIRILQSAHSNSCLRGLPEDLQICFEGAHGAFNFISSDPGGIEFHDYQAFHDLWIARRLISHPESGTTIQLTVDELSDLPEQSAMAQTADTPAQRPLLEVSVAQVVSRAFLKSNAELQWPAIHGGKTKGVVKVLIGIGPDGRVREVWPEGSDNGDLEDFARAQIRNWQFTPYLLSGNPIAISTEWVIPFDVKIAQ